ncbi:MAG TPA: glutamate mutase L [Chloroflexota bacterium]|nr:glutamate mutase L [Chloroflexota bacterium]
MAVAPRNPSSLLGIDCGSAFTKVALIERVEGRYRVIARGSARTTLDTHILDGVSRACSEIEWLTGRRLFAQGQLISGDVSGNRGVEAVAASLTCQPPLQLLVTDAATAAAAARGPCQVTLLARGAISERLAQAQSSRWDALAGGADEIAALAHLLEGDPAGTVRRTGLFDAPRLISGDSASIERQVQALALEHAARGIPGYAELSAACTEPLVTGADALARLTGLIAGRFKLRLAIVDCGASTVMASVATPDDLPELKRRVCRPPGIPLTDDDLSLAQLATESAIHALIAGLSVDLLVGTGAIFSSAPRPAQAGLMLLNGARPRGVVQLACDMAGVLSQLAALAVYWPDAAAAAMEADGLVGLGTAICPRGSGQAGRKALDVSFSIGDEPTVTRAFNIGELGRVALAPGQQAKLQLFPAGSLDVGLGQNGAAASTTVDGGAIGLMVDARLGQTSGSSSRDAWLQALEARPL